MINPVAFSVFGHDIRWYGIIIAIALLLGILLAMHHMKRQGHNPDWILDLALIVVPLAVICARIYYVVFQWNEVYAQQPFWHVFAIWEGGLAIYGAVIGGFLGVWIYTRFVNKKVRFPDLLDILAPSLILGQAIGRWGNFVNQEAYGMAVTNPAWQWFPAAVYIQRPSLFDGVSVTYPEPGWFMATFFYESIWNFIVFAFLFFYFKKSKDRRPGNVFWFYLLLYGIGRVVIEGLREDSLYLGSIRISQWLSGLLVVASACVLLYPWARKTFLSIRKDVEARREEAMKAPLDESLRLIRDEDRPEDETEAAEEPAEAPKTADEVVGALVADDIPEDKKEKEDDSQ